MGIHDRDYYQADELRPLRPWDNRSMVTLLIIANVAVFCANFLFTQRDNALNDFLALSPIDLRSPLHWPRLLTYGFAHFDMRHILFNMIGLYFLGQGVESKYGKWEFCRFYLIAVVICGLVWSLSRQGEGSKVIGASGAVTAVAMLFVFSFPRATLQLYGVIPIKAWLLGVMIIVMNLLGNRSAFSPEGEPQVAYDIHLVGAGFAAAYFFLNLNFSALGSVLESVPNWIRGKRTRFKQKRQGLKVHRPEIGNASNPSKDEIESDRILEKILRQGKDSLTAKEQAFMENYSRKVRQRRGQE